MDYNDFPILNNDQYKTISEHFLLNKTFDRKSFLFKICNELKNCSNAFLHLPNNYNKKVKDALNFSKTILIKWQNNFISTFNINTLSSQTILNENIFIFIKKIIDTISLTETWQNHEPKKYYKSLAQKCIIELLDILNKIISALDESNFYFFKHM